jgi:hypothetical protein
MGMEKIFDEIESEEVIKDVQKVYDLIEKCKVTKHYVKLMHFGKFFENNNKYAKLALEIAQACEAAEVGITGDECYVEPPTQAALDLMPNFNFDRSKIPAPRGKN